VRWHVAVEECLGAVAQLVDQNVTVEVVAAFAGLDDQPGNAAIEQRLDHPTEALGSDIAVAALAVIDQRGYLAARDDGVGALHGYLHRALSRAGLLGIRDAGDRSWQAVC
jgi:hypothetical protein